MKKPRKDMESAIWPTDKLRLHPKQLVLFNELGGSQLDDLRDDIEKNGLREPLEVSPSGEVISGRRRLRAIRELQWTKVAVVVRHDLAAQGEDVIERRLIEANLNRRQLSILDRARLYARLKELARCNKGRDGGGEVREFLGKRLGKSGRQLDRLLPLIHLPRAIQEAVDEKRIPVKTATLLAKLPREAQDKVADVIAKQGGVRKTVSGVLFAHGLIGRGRSTDDQLKARLRTLLLEGRRLADEAERLRPMVRQDQLPKLQLLADFVLDLFPTGADPAKNGQGKSKSKGGSKPRPR